MSRRSSPAAPRLSSLRLVACGLVLSAFAGTAAKAAEEPPHSAALDAAIVRAAKRHGIPESLVRRVVMRESKYNPSAKNRSYWGLMQISYPTARSMGFHGSPSELLNPVVNLRYAVPYLANAFVIAGRRQEEAVRLYAAGYYYTARTRGLIGALRTADSAPLAGVPDEPEFAANAAQAPTPVPEESPGLFGALFGPSEMPRDQATQQAVYAAAQPAAADGNSGADVALAADKAGNLRPPKSWQRDGGTTMIARGEQAVEQTAAAKGAEAGDTGRRRHARKTTQFASLDTPATAQAYAAAPGQDPRLMQADSQAAISQATAGQPQAAAPAAEASAGADDPSKKGRRKRMARRSRRHETEPEAAVAQSQPQGQPPVLSSDQQAAAGPEAQPAAPVQSAEATPPQDAGAAAQAQFEQAAGPRTAEAEPARHRKRQARRGRSRSATEVATQASGDGQPQPVQQQPAAQ